jgi:hypothetical protein
MRLRVRAEDQKGCWDDWAMTWGRRFGCSRRPNAANFSGFHAKAIHASRRCPLSQHLWEER